MTAGSGKSASVRPVPESGAPRLLIVTTYFAPAQAVGGRRMEALARGMVARGWEVTVLAPEVRYTPPVDPTLEPPDGVKVVRTPTCMLPVLYRPRHEVGSAPRRPAVPGRRRLWWEKVKRAALWMLQESVLVPDHFTGWLPIARRRMEGERFDVIVASIPSFRSAEVGRVLALERGVPLVLDYRDPWTDYLIHCRTDVSRQLVWRHRRHEARCLRAAAAVVGVTPTLCAWLEARSGMPCTLVRNGYRGALQVREARAPASGGPVVLVYAGSLAYGRSIEPLARVVARLVESEGIRLRLRYIGGDAERAFAQAHAAGAEAWLETTGPLSRQQVQDQIGRAHAAVVVVSPAYSYALPGKLYDILSTGTPVLQLAPTGCDAETLVRAHGLGWSHPADDEAGLAESVRAIAEGRIPKPTGVEELSEASMQAAYAALIESLLRNRE